MPGLPRKPSATVDLQRESLSEIRERFESCIDSSSDGIWDWDLRTNQVWYSDQFLASVDCEREDFPSHIDSFNERLHPDDRDRVRAAVDEHLSNATRYDVELRLRTKVDTYRWFRSRGGVLRDDDGLPIRMAGTIHSIESQKNAEALAANLARELEAEVAERKAAEAMYFDLYNNSPDLYVSVDASTGLIQRCNQTIADRLGRAQGELIGLPIESVYHSSCLAQVRQVLEQFRHSGHVHNAELNLRARDGSPIPVILNVSPIRDADGTIIASRSVWRDISELVEARTLLQNLNRDLESRVEQRTRELEKQIGDLDQFARVASHDLKAPLHGIRMTASWLREDCYDLLPRDSQKHLNELQSRVERMDNLLKSILELSRIGRSPTPTEATDTNVLVNQTLQNLSRPDTFVIAIANDMPVLMTQHQQLQRVFQNLIGNAIKHRKSDTGHVEVTWKPVGDGIEFTVADDGNGIEPKYRQRVFEMFQTLRPRDEVEGSGIGLAIVKRLVESNGGSIELEDSSIGGAAFRFTWIAPILSLTQPEQQT